MKRFILFFGKVRDVAGTSMIEIVLPPEVCDVASLIDWLGAQNDYLGEALRATGVRVALDRAFATPDARLDKAQEIAFMSPLSGG